eukprot:5305286-Amphidinium_carterae.1
MCPSQGFAWDVALLLSNPLLAASALPLQGHKEAVDELRDLVDVLTNRARHATKSMCGGQPRVRGVLFGSSHLTHESSYLRYVSLGATPPRGLLLEDCLLGPSQSQPSNALTHGIDMTPYISPSVRRPSVLKTPVTPTTTIARLCWCMSGPPGVGKTHCARALAGALHKHAIPFQFCPKHMRVSK